MTGRVVRASLLFAMGAIPLWAQSPAPAPTPPPHVVTSLLLFAGGDSGLVRSRDWGSAWEKVVKGLEELGAVHAIVAAAPYVYLGGEGGFFLSSDFGETWTRLYADSPVLSFCVSRYPQSDRTLFLGTRDGLLKSSDLGRTYAPTPLKGVPVLRIEWPGPDLLVVTRRGVLVSRDGGASFSGPGLGLPPGETRALALSSFYAMDPVLFAATDVAGVFRSRDGAKSWTFVGLSGRRISDIVWLGSMLYATSAEGVQRSEDAGDHWAALGEGLPAAAANALLFPSAPDSGAEVFVATDVGIFHSQDAGQHWQPTGLKGEVVSVLATFPPPSGTKARKH